MQLFSHAKFAETLFLLSFEIRFVATLSHFADFAQTSTMSESELEQMSENTGLLSFLAVSDRVVVNVLAGGLFSCTILGEGKQGPRTITTLE